MQRRLPWVVMLILGLAVTGCGQKGPLYLESQGNPEYREHPEPRATASAPADTVARDREALAGNGPR
ncbi:LPS translocon maturation chaperone LptM [Marinobacter sp. SS21]|uniref:LPS translocon maturation chaperone LptM n=1 Tax=Marinobacter sp. SS21 TaxID=2979460 RepID=UPI00232D8EC6|nr:lipoprotein [Marinobacter sp. SS21]MDC0661331.1 lipoprotein [Marinobacter sp. SS21]